MTKNVSQWLLVYVLAVLIVGAYHPAGAALKETDPRTVCSYLNQNGLPARGWKNYGPSASSAGHFGCNSSYKELAGSALLKNNLAYYVDGQQSKVTSLYLVLNVNDRATASSAHKALLDAADILSRKTAGTPIPPNIRRAILSGDKAAGVSAGTSIRVIRLNWPTGKGYEVKVFFE